MNIKQKIRLSRGMSLIETIVAMAIFAIMTLLVVTIFAFSNKQYMLANRIDNNTDSEGATIEQGGSTSSLPTDMTFGGDINISVHGDINTVGNSDDQVVLNYFTPTT